MSKEKVLNIIDEHLNSNNIECYLFYVNEIIKNNESFDNVVCKQVESFGLDLIEVAKYLEKKLMDKNLE